MFGKINIYRAHSGYAVNIFDTDENRVLCFELFDILKWCRQYNSDLAWTVFLLWTTGKEDSTINIGPLVDEIHRPGGKFFQYAELLEVSRNFLQVIDCLIVGHPPGFCLPENPSLEEACRFGHTVIQVFDGSYWMFYSRNKQLFDKVIGHFHDIKPARFISHQ